MSLLERRITKLERPNMDAFDTRVPTSWQEFYLRIKDDGPSRQSAPALSASEGWAICSMTLSQADDVSIDESWRDYLDTRHHWR